MKIKLLSLGFVFCFCFCKAQLKLDEKLAINGYMDMLLLGADVQPVGKFVYLTTHRVNLQTQFAISSKFSATLLLEGADLFRLDEPNLQQKPGIMEWAYLNYKHSDWLNFRAGMFALPFGIYNESFYATPTQLTTLLPSAYAQHSYGVGAAQFSDFMFPRSASGLMAYGKLLNHDRHILKYYAYFTNEIAQLNAFGFGKYAGGRLLYETATSEMFKLGVSYNTYILSGKQANNTIGADIQFRWKNFQIFTEAVLPQIGVRDTLQQPVGGQYYEGFSGYAQVGYTIKDFVTPYVRYDYYDGNSAIGGDAVSNMIVGLNFAFHPQVIFKLEGYRAESETPGVPITTVVLSTLAVAF